MTNFPKDFTNSEKWLLQTAVIIGYAANPVERYYNRDDFYLDSEIEEYFAPGERIHCSLEEMRDMRSKPALITTMEYGRTDYVTRITKLGWKKAWELANRYMEYIDVYYPLEYKGERFWLELDNA